MRRAAPAALAAVLACTLLPRPAAATWSVLAVDARTGRLVVASATCVPQGRFARFGPGGAKGLMDIQAVVVPGIGAAAAQAGVDVTRRNQWLIFRQLQAGTPPAEIIRMLHADPALQRRQFGIVDMRGRTAGFSGADNGAASLDVQGKVPDAEIYYSIQGNILASDAVVHDAVAAFLAAGPDLKDRVMAAMEAADLAGGDRRCTCTTEPVLEGVACDHRTAHVAYLLEARAGDRDGASYNDGRYSLYIDVTDENIRPYENACPVVTLRQRYEAWKAAREEVPPPVSPRELTRTADPYARGYTDADFPRVQEIAPGVYTYEQLRSAGEESFTTVSMFVVSREGVLVADGQGSVEETRRLVEHIRRVTDAPITHVVIASDHGDHTAGNSAFPADAEFIAHPNSARALEAAAARAAAGEGAPPVVLPTRLVADREVLHLGGRPIEIRFLGRAHTGGDLVVYLPEEKVLFMSEAYLHRVFPAMRSAYPSDWVRMIERAQAMDVEWYVPGHGFVDPPHLLREELETFRRAVVKVIDVTRALHARGLTLEEAQAAADFGGLETWSLHASQAPRAIQRIYAELNGTLR